MYSIHPLINYASFPFAPQTCYESLQHSPFSVSQLPGEAVSLQACVWCCPMCTVEGANPRTGGGVQGTGGGHGVRTQGSRDGYRRGMVKENVYVSETIIYAFGLIIFYRKPALFLLFTSVPASVQESPMELFHHPTWDQRIWQSNEPRYIHYWQDVIEKIPQSKIPIHFYKRISVSHLCCGLRHSWGGLCARSVLSSRGSGSDPSMHSWGTGEVWLWQEGQGC